jgi:hypothetical protein
MSPTTGVEPGVTVTVAEALVVPPAPVQLNVYVEVEVGDTLSELEVLLVPLQAPDAVQEVALVEDQVRVDDEPDVMEVGKAESETVGDAAVTVTVALAVMDPVALVAVRVYVVVAVGLTDLDVPVTVPIPWLIESDVAFETDQLKVDELPDVILVGDAVKDEMVGA